MNIKEGETIDEENYLNCIIEDIRNEEKAVDRCYRCKEDDPIVLEEHHLFGRANSDKTILLCKNCHARVTHEQNKVPPKARSKNASYPERTLFQLLTIGVLIRDLGTQIIKVTHELMSFVKNCNSGLYSTN